MLVVLLGFTCVHTHMILTLINIRSPRRSRTCYHGPVLQGLTAPSGGGGGQPLSELGANPCDWQSHDIERKA
jgi:hypothetical protein